MNKNAFDFIRNSLNRIADGIASSDGRYPVWDYKSLLELINTLEEEYKKNDGASARSSLQQTCNNLATDCVYRQQAIDAVNEWLRLYAINRTMGNVTSLQDVLRQLPSAQPYTEEQIQKMQDMEQAQLEEAYKRGYEEGQSEIIQVIAWMPLPEPYKENKDERD